MTDDHARYENDLAASLLGALEEDEARTLEAHLEDCAHCRAELERLRVAADALPRSVMQVSPPPSLKASLMSEVRKDTAPERRPLRDRFRGLVPDLGGMRPAMAWMSAAFLVAVGILSGWGVTQLTDSGEPRVISAQVDDTRAPFGSASLVVPEEGKDGAMLRVNGMPTLSSDRVYQLWVVRDGMTVPTDALFSVGEDGRGSSALPESIEDADAVLVTREPAGGARAPSEEPLVSVQL